MSRTGRKLALVLVLSVAGATLLSCAKDPVAVDRNRPPQTFLVGAPIDTTAADVGYNYRIHLYWRGEDPDGYVVGFLYSWDDSSIGSFRFTSRTDSVFELAVNDSELISSGVGNPQTSRYHTFFIRAVDNLGKPDPSLTIFNRRLFNAETEVPRVTFVGDIPSGTALIDTLCDAAPFTVCWSGRDPDGFVTMYRVDAGSYRGPLTTDSCITFNTPGGPTLASGLYTMTVTAVDNANAVGTGSVQFVVNRDPETRFVDSESPVKQGRYIRHFRLGNLVHETGTFAEGDTIPYRSTVWFYWEGEDSHGGCEPDSLTGFSFRLDPGTRNGNDPYIIGFLDVLSEDPPIRFTSNDPGRLTDAGFPQLILDSLDAGIDMVARVAARDNAQRADGTPATFRFNCNFPPTLDSVFVDSVFVDPDGGGAEPAQPCRLIRWQGIDDEDGLTKFATVTLDESSVRELFNFEQQIIVPDRTFRALSPSGIEHSVRVRVADRAEYKSALPDGMKTVTFTIPLLTP